MKLHGEWMHERRRGSIALRWDFHSWGIGVHGGVYLDDWMVVGIDECYWVAWVKFSLGPCDLELACYGSGRKWEEEKWVSLHELREGAIFETKDGIKAMKTEYQTFNGGTQCDCYLLESGEAAHFPNKDGELVLELSEREWNE